VSKVLYKFSLFNLSTQDILDPFSKNKIIWKWAYELFDEKEGRLYNKLKQLKKINIEGKEYPIEEYIQKGKEKYEESKARKEVGIEPPTDLKNSVEKILSYLNIINDDEINAIIYKINNEIEYEIYSKFKKEKEEKQKLKEEILNLKRELQSEREKVSEVPGYLTTGSVGIISGFISSLLKKKSPKLPKWVTISIIPATVIPSAFLTEYTLPEGRKPEGLGGLFKKEYIEKRGKHLIGKSLVGILTGLTTYSIMQKFIK